MPMPSTVQLPLDPAGAAVAPRALIAAAVARTSSPSSKPEISVRPTASAPSINARCEIDLSPGTRILPASEFDGRAIVRGGAGRGEAGRVTAKGPLCSAQDAVAVKQASANMLEPDGTAPIGLHSEVCF
jgi:hypothetical protein